MAIVINGSGTVTGISVGGLPDSIVDAGTLADNAVGLAQMAGGTDGNIITYDTSGNPAVVATGSDGQVLTSAGADAVPAFEAAPGGGKILQVVSNTITSSGSSSNNVTPAATGLTATITPSATSSKVLVMWEMPVRRNPTDAECYLYLYEGAVQIIQLGNILNMNSGDYWETTHASGAYLHSPADTSAVTYNLYGKPADGTMDWNSGGSSVTMILMEVDGS